MEEIDSAIVPINKPVVACNPESLPLYKNPIYSPEVGRVVEVWLTVVEPVKVGAPNVREEQDRELQVTPPQVRFFVPIFKSVVREDPFQHTLNISVYEPALTEYRDVKPPTFCCSPPPIAPPYPPTPCPI